MKPYLPVGQLLVWNE